MFIDEGGQKVHTPSYKINKSWNIVYRQHDCYCFVSKSFPSLQSPWLWPAKSCPTLWDPMVCGLPDSSVHGISQAGILEWVAISFPRGSSQPRNQTCGFFTTKPSGNLYSMVTIVNDIVLYI